MTSAPSPLSGRTPQPLLIRDVRLGPGGPAANVLVADGRIAAVGPELSASEAGEVVEGAGRTVLPGFWDAHVHIVQWASARRRVNLAGATSARAAAELMADAAREGRVAPGEPLIGFGFRDGLWADRPEPALLAWAGEEQAVALVSQDLHTAWFSRGALRAVGRDGHPTGVLREHDCLDAVARLGQADAETVDRWVADALRAAAARGVVGILDFEFADNCADWRRRAARGPLDVRVRSAIYPEYLDEAVAAGLRTGDVLADTGGLVEVGPLKLFVDGSLNTRTALCNDPYPGTLGAPGALPEQERFGILQTPPDELVRLMTRAAENGIEPAVHAIGDRANTIALDAFDRLGCPGRIEHAQLIDHADLHRFARPGLILGVQPAHATDDRDIADHHWAGRTDRAYAYADLARAGATLEIGSDAPVSPLDPWEGIAAAVHRTDDDREPWHPEQAIPLDDALAAAARGRRGLRVGDPADLVIVDHDPSGLAPHELREMPVHATLVGGRWTHRA
ncbi:amidohydrolase family protein [Thermopolyspora sp. NPDC052614]|uniref:amidohydrolase n=1 Tax=Thermopolyspora sp. NPDC052614 TaxID=3155682 RepID=UPI003423E627